MPAGSRDGDGWWRSTANRCASGASFCGTGGGATLVIDKAVGHGAAQGLAARHRRRRRGAGEAITAGLSEMLADLSAAERRDDGRIEEAARQAVRRVVRAHLGKKPLTDVHIVRI